MMNFPIVSLNTLTFIFSRIDMDSGESYHSESEFYYSDEMKNDYEKENILRSRAVFKTSGTASSTKYGPLGR